MSKQRCYLDYNASHPLRAEARAAMLAALDTVGNPSSVHAEGRAARAIVEAARVDVAALVDAAPADVVFTSGASESNAWVIASGWSHLFASRLEHDSVLKPLAALGDRVTWLSAMASGVINLEAFAATFSSRSPTAQSVNAIDRGLACLVAANSETGTIQPLPRLLEIARDEGVAVFSDATQVAGRLPIVDALGVDYLSLSSHKIGGPKGVGALVIRSGLELPKLIPGGGQERGRRAGTENVAGIAGFGAAARAALARVALFERLSEHRDMLLAGLRDVTPDLVVFGDTTLANTLCIGAPGLQADAAVIQLDLAGVAVSAGSACSSGKVGTSQTLAAMGVDPLLARTAVRFSVGEATTSEELNVAISAWRDIAARRKIAA